MTKTTEVATRFARLPGSARLWVFGVEPAPDPAQEQRVLEEVAGFLAGWEAHGKALSAASEWLYHRFLIVAADEDVTPPSGCSIDALVHRLRDLETELGLEIVGSAPLWYRANTDGGREGVRRVSRKEFKALAERGEIGADTMVFDLSITRLEDFRNGRWEVPAAESWHGRYLT